MKRSLAERLKSQSLFIKMFLVTLVSIVAVAVLVMWTTVRMSEKLFMETFSITNSKVISQIKANFEAFHYSIVTAANNTRMSGTIKRFLTEGDSSSLSEMKSYYSMIQQMKKIQTNLDPYGASMKIMGSNGRSYSTNTNRLLLTDAALRRHPLTAGMLREPGKLSYSFYREDDAAYGAPSSPLIVATRALTAQNGGEPYGQLYITIPGHEFRSFYANFASSGNDVAIVNGEGKVVSSSLRGLEGESGEQLLEAAARIRDESLGYTELKFRGRQMIALADELPLSDYTIVNLIDKRTALGQIVNTKAVALICSGIVLAALIVVFLISRRLTRSLTLLVRQMSKITERGFHNYIKVPGSFEFQELAHAYNYMLDEVKRYVVKLMETQKEQRNAELAALQHQINPHFLYNTLASVKFLVQQGSRDKAVETIHALISMLQHALGSVSETITVREELEQLKAYAFINHVRYGERIRVNYFVSPDCLEYRVPKLILQPFVENAFFHAFHTKAEGVIHVLISREREGLLCEVMDNGDGMDTDAAKRGTRGQGSRRQLFTGIGIQNVHDRIVLLYGERYGIEIISRPGEGTRIRIRLPLQEKPINFQESKENTTEAG